jgi:heme-degrading monooxygenase HmoA
MYVVMKRLQSTMSYAVHLERAYRYAGTLKDIPGFVGFQFLRDDRVTADSTTVRYVALTQWESREAYAEWSKGESFGDPAGDTADSPVTVEIECYEVLE